MISLGAQPSAPVTVTAKAPVGSGLSAEPRTVRFTPADWDKPRTFTASLEEREQETGKTLTIEHSAAGGGYDGESASMAVQTEAAEPEKKTPRRPRPSPPKGWPPYYKEYTSRTVNPEKAQSTGSKSPELSPPTVFYWISQ